MGLIPRDTTEIVTGLMFYEPSLLSAHVGVFNLT